MNCVKKSTFKGTKRAKIYLKNFQITFSMKFLEMHKEFQNFIGKLMQTILVNPRPLLLFLRCKYVLRIFLNKIKTSNEN